MEPLAKPINVAQEIDGYRWRSTHPLPKAEHDADEWQAAMQALLLVAEHDGPPMFARIGIMRALNRCVERSRARTSIGDKLARDQ